MTRTHRVHHAAQAEQIALLPHGLAAGLFRRHILRRAGNYSRPRHRRVVHRTGQPKVRNGDAFYAVFQQDVRRFDVTVDEPLRVRGLQSVSDLGSDPQDLSDAERPVDVNPLLQRRAAEVRHHQVGQ